MCDWLFIWWDPKFSRHDMMRDSVCIGRTGPQHCRPLDRATAITWLKMSSCEEVSLQCTICLPSVQTHLSKSSLSGHSALLVASHCQKLEEYTLHCQPTRWSVGWLSLPVLWLLVLLTASLSHRDPGAAWCYSRVRPDRTSLYSDHTNTHCSSAANTEPARASKSGENWW